MRKLFPALCVASYVVASADQTALSWMWLFRRIHQGTYLQHISRFHAFYGRYSAVHVVFWFGSLGGLVRNALPEQFELVFRNMLQEASWCSSDPICIESKAQGYDSLNYAACHACTLLPETSCEMRNCLLDRGAVVGSLLDRKRGFFGDLFE